MSVSQSGHLQLPRGTTGFRHAGDPALPSVDTRAFRSDLYDVARRLNARVVHAGQRKPESACNFVDAQLEVYEETLAVLLNSIHPILAFATKPRWRGSLHEFVDHDDLRREFLALRRYSVLSKSDLDQPVTDESIGLLAPAEVGEIKYWKPPRIGDVIFNWWD